MQTDLEWHVLFLTIENSTGCTRQVWILVIEKATVCMWQVWISTIGFEFGRKWQVEMLLVNRAPCCKLTFVEAARKNATDRICRGRSFKCDLTWYLFVTAGIVALGHGHLYIASKIGPGRICHHRSFKEWPDSKQFLIATTVGVLGEERIEYATKMTTGRHCHGRSFYGDITWNFFVATVVGAL